VERTAVTQELVALVAQAVPRPQVRPVRVAMVELPALPALGERRSVGPRLVAQEAMARLVAQVAQVATPAE